MAGKGGGGAWKVAYADFVTAMMAFFLVMWIAGQDQKVKRAVSYYFQDPFSASEVGSSRKPNKSGSLTELTNTGNVPQSESVAMGRGRGSYTRQNENSVVTKLVSEWIYSDKEANNYWQTQVQQQREEAHRSKEVANKYESADKVAARQLAKQMKEEIIRGIPAQTKDLYKELIREGVSGVNWTEIAEDLLTHY